MSGRSQTGQGDMYDNSTVMKIVYKNNIICDDEGCSKLVMLILV